MHVPVHKEMKVCQYFLTSVVLPGSAPGFGSVVGRRSPPASAVTAPASAAVAITRPGPGASSSAAAASTAAVPATSSALSGRHLDADPILETKYKFSYSNCYIHESTF